MSQHESDLKWGGFDVMLDETSWPTNSRYADVRSRLMDKKTDRGG